MHSKHNKGVEQLKFKIKSYCKTTEKIPLLLTIKISMNQHNLNAENQPWKNKLRNSNSNNNSNMLHKGNTHLKIHP